MDRLRAGVFCTSPNIRRATKRPKHANTSFSMSRRRLTFSSTFIPTTKRAFAMRRSRPAAIFAVSVLTSKPLSLEAFLWTMRSFLALLGVLSHCSVLLGCVYGPWGPLTECENGQQTQTRSVLKNLLGNECSDTKRTQQCRESNLSSFLHR